MTPEEMDMDTELDKALAEKNWPLAQATLTKMWLTSQVALTQRMDPNLKELTFLKTPVDTGDGKYLLLFIHVDGKKIQL